uniref:Col_cuticle_N domain-containing protein n=1 Tax=Meloidogyne hapla TaxID=6305 RepID=A0A1I8BEE0_MELHA
MRSRRSSSSASSAQPPFIISAFGTDLGSIESIPSFRRNFYIKEEINNSFNCLTKFSCLLALLAALLIVTLSAIALKDILLQQFINQTIGENFEVKQIQINNTGNKTF